LCAISFIESTGAKVRDSPKATCVCVFLLTLLFRTFAKQFVSSIVVLAVVDTRSKQTQI